MRWGHAQRYNISIKNYYSTLWHLWLIVNSFFPFTLCFAWGLQSWKKKNETSRPPLPRFNDVRMARFCSSRLQHCFEEEGELIVPFYSVQDCGRSGVNLSPASFWDQGKRKRVNAHQRWLKNRPIVMRLTRTTWERSYFHFRVPCWLQTGSQWRWYFAESLLNLSKLWVHYCSLFHECQTN